MSTSSKPMPPTGNEVVGRRNIFVWCPNRHLHGIKFMHSIHEVGTDTWGKKYSHSWGWICMKCFLRKYDTSQ